MVAEFWETMLTEAKIAQGEKLAISCHYFIHIGEQVQMKTLKCTILIV